MGRIALFCAIWMALNTATRSITTMASTSNYTASNNISMLMLSVSTSLPVQSLSPPVTSVSPIIKEAAAANVPLVTQYPYSTTIVIVTTVTKVAYVSIICTRTYSNYPIPFPSPTINHQYTITETQYASKSGMVACNMKQANSAAGVVGGLIGGSIFGFVLTVVVTVMATILIIKHHKKGKRYHHSRYL